MTALAAPPDTTVKAAVETITPEYAKALLETNTHNRNARKRAVDNLAGALIRGEWELNGESVKIDRNGNLTDGQHRLMACVQANLPLVTVVVRGVEPAAQETIDTGAKRNMGDMLKLRGEKDTAVLAASLRYLYSYLVGRTMQTSLYQPTPQQLISLLNRHPELRESLPVGSRVKNRGVQMTPSVVAVGHYLFSDVDEEDADHFFDRLATGLELEEASPIYSLRRAIDRAARSPHPPLQFVRAAYMVKAWNAYRNGRELNTLTWKPGGMNPEAFPRISGLDTAELDPLAG